MKKNLSILLAGIMVCSLFTACGKENSTDVSTDAAFTDVASSDARAAADDAAAAGSSVAEFTTDFDSLETITLGDITASDYVTLGEYTGVTAEATLAEVTDEDVENYVNNIKSSNPPMTEVTDRAVQDGDTVNIDYVGKFADTQEAFDGGTASGANLVIGSGSYIEGFESGLIGVEIGQTVDLNLTFPEDYGSADLAGKDVIFTVTVNSISVAAEDVTDDWAKGLGIDGVTTLDELNAYAKQELEADAEEEYKATIENSALLAVMDNATFTAMPEKLVNRYIVQQKQMMDYRANMYSYYYGYTMTAADVVSVYAQNAGFDGTIDDYLRSIAEETTQQYVLFQAIADELEIDVTEEEIDDYLRTAYESAGSTAFSSFEDYKASLDIEIYREGLMAEKVVDYIVANANVVEAQAE